MAGLSKSLGSLIGMGRSPKLPPLPGGLGLPEKSGFIGRAKGEDYGGEGYDKQLSKANTYNKAFADLLNRQQHLNGGERREIYEAYSDKFVPISYKKVDPNYKSPDRGRKALPEHLFYDYGKTLSQAPAMTEAQQQAANRPATPAAPTPAPTPAAKPAAKPVTAAPKPVPTPAPTPAPAPVVQPPPTVGPVAKPQEQATPVTATASGNIAGQTATTGAGATGGRGRRGRMQTLLTGLGGAIERFGL